MMKEKIILSWLYIDLDYTENQTEHSGAINPILIGLIDLDCTDTRLIQWSYQFYPYRNDRSRLY